MPSSDHAVPFMEADAMSVGWHDRSWNWITRYEGVFRLAPGFGGVVRWHCPHLHETPEAAMECAVAEVKRRFGDAGRLRGMFEGTSRHWDKTFRPARAYPERGDGA